MSGVKKTMNGDNNKQLHSLNATNRESSIQAWDNKQEMDEKANVYIPSEYSVKKAKDWVDNGSQL